MNQQTKDLIEEMLCLKGQNTRMAETLRQLEMVLNTEEENAIEQAEKWKESQIRCGIDIKDIRRVCGFEMPEEHARRIKRLTEEADKKR